MAPPHESQQQQPTSVFFAGGGTGGHLYPGIAVAEALRAARPDLRPVFLCTTKSIDRVILEHTGFEFVTQPILPLPKVTNVSGLLRFWKAWRETKDQVRQLIRERKPAAVLGLGGYAAGVGVKEAAQQGVPTAVLNPDVIPGKANQYLMKYVRAVCCQFEATTAHVPKGEQPKLQFTGCPIRSDIRTPPAPEAAAERLGLDPSLNTLVVTGASLGAKTVNDAVIEMFKGMTLRGWQILHLTGRDHADAVRAGYRELEIAARILDFTPAMADVWAVATVAISRAGASSCAELTACGVPSILLPYPFHKDMHQRANAQVLADAGAAVLLEDEKDQRKTAEKLRPVVQALLYNADKRRTMSEAARKLGRPDAADAVAGVLTGMMAPAIELASQRP
jgi:UDP-N-acetylglucosamine--N-acetylmuramyl-(pentapeptide) pyrophosphoryl-undecaprenol N-acetylglucosamine transferase